MHKVITVNVNRCNTVLLSRERNAEETDNVRIQSWHQIDDLWYINEQYVDMDEALIPMFIRDFSQESANEFANSVSF